MSTPIFWETKKTFKLSSAELFYPDKTYHMYTQRRLKSVCAFMSVFVVHMSVFVVHMSVFVVHMSVFVVHMSVFVVHMSVFVVHMSVFVVHMSVFHMKAFSYLAIQNAPSEDSDLNLCWTHMSEVGISYIAVPLMNLWVRFLTLRFH